jgi:hypothetical protein
MQTIETRIGQQKELIAMILLDLAGRTPGSQACADRVNDVKQAEAWLVFLEGFKARQDAEAAA